MLWIAPSDKDADNAALEKRFWDAADQFRANSDLNSQEYSAPVLGLIFLRFAEVRPSFTNQQINSVVANENEHDPFFVYHLFTTLRDELRSNAGGAATPIINKTAFSEIEVSVPPLPVQRRIAGILSAYDELMETSQRRIRLALKTN